MKPKLIIIFIFLIIFPMIILAWFGKRIARDEERLIRERINNVLTGRLADINSGISKFVRDKERELLKVISRIRRYNHYELHELTRNNPLVRQIFIREKDGKISYPYMHSYAEVRSSKFFERTKSIWDSGVRFYHTATEGARSDNTFGWYSWFWAEGVHFIFWKKLGNGKVIGIELNRVAFMADLIGQLPETKQLQEKIPLSRIVLTNAKNEIIYQWGKYNPESDQQPTAKLALSPPLEAWNLQFYIPVDGVEDTVGDSTMFNLVSGLIASMVAVLLLGFYFYRENTREINDAVQKVSFVNKVSHELKTPLTNIRMYAELLENSVSKRDKKSRKYTGIVITESQRLSRLINNVLTFAKKQKGNLVINKQYGIPDETIACIMDNFAPSLKEKGIRVSLKTNARQRVLYDEDALTQIVCNLINNVEKYAYAGKYLGVTTRLQKNRLIIIVEDHGPGISEKNARNIFRPFYRISNRLSDGVTGTGIGLTIARDLALLHDGEIRVESKKNRTLFIVELRIEKEEDSV